MGNIGNVESIVSPSSYTNKPSRSVTFEALDTMKGGPAMNDGNNVINGIKDDVKSQISFSVNPEIKESVGSPDKMYKVTDASVNTGDISLTRDNASAFSRWLNLNP